jgi:uncharacterized protein YbaR (Trm112 family)
MPFKQPDIVTCPKCSRSKGLSLHIIAEVATAMIRIPILKGKVAPTKELFLESQLSGDKAFLRYSDIKRQTRLSIFEEEIDISIHCQFCKKMYPVSEEYKLK